MTDDSLTLLLQYDTTTYNLQQSMTVFSSTDKNPSTGEKVVVSGFVIFALIVLTAYTATSAAFLVSIGKNYRNLDEVISSSKAHGVCVSEMVYDVVLEQHPHAVRSW